MGKPTRIGFFWASATCGEKKANVTKLRTIQNINDFRIFFLLSKKAFASRVCQKGFCLYHPSFLCWLLPIPSFFDKSPLDQDRGGSPGQICMTPVCFRAYCISKGETCQGLFCKAKLFIIICKEPKTLNRYLYCWRGVIFSFPLPQGGNISFSQDLKGDDYEKNQLDHMPSILRFPLSGFDLGARRRELYDRA
jgi:hypothetical protein